MVLGVLGALLGAWWLGALVGAVAGGAAVAWWLAGTSERVLQAVDAVPVPSGEQPRLRNLVDGLCATSGLPVPALSIIDVDAANSLAVGTSPDDTTLVLTRGLLDRLDRIELEGVVARELARVRRGEVALATLLVPLGSIAPGLLARFLPDRYDVRADIEAVGLTRYPPGLTRALEKTGTASAVPHVPRSTSHLWLDDPSPTGGEPPATAHSPIEERIATLQEL
ncbi:M48 family metalloprotease [Actinomarinicola tropica]|uniref:M48 family metalloprotease n=1 Tax=Actinomarinicola tropica TaxID=2789776 RepID=A0A5Q2RMN4_9ACTN|nr:M48 family metalloprotease [Actinomarinicola tropica]QGG95140.1 M48 family metalloprotease [Actinomarinicola tropica]